MNNRLDRRHDINAGERLPERFTRVQDMEKFWEGVERVTNALSDPEALQRTEEEKERVAMELAEKKANIKKGDVVFLFWTGVQVVRVYETAETHVVIGETKYGWELVQKPSEAFLKALEAELPGVVL